MPDWPIGAVSKIAVPLGGNGGSNPPLSASTLVAAMESIRRHSDGLLTLHHTWNWGAVLAQVRSDSAALLVTLLLAIVVLVVVLYWGIHNEQIRRRKCALEMIGLKCPKCGSTKLQAGTRGYDKEVGGCGCLLAGLLGLLLGFLHSSRLVCTCLACGYKFERPG